MNERRSIQDIIPPARSRPVRQHQGTAPQPPKESGPSRPERKIRPPKIRKRGSGIFGLVGIALGVLVIIVVAFVIVSLFFHRADISISLKTFTVPVAETFEATPEGVLLSYTEKIVSSRLTKSVARSGSEYIEERASGIITIFNAYSSSNQRLITNTRFESPEGRIYRVKDPVVVPGYKTNGGEIVPGSIDVTVYADQPGQEYNTGLVEFTIPGLKGTDQFETMYARSKTSMTGGFVGEQAIVSPEIRDAALVELRSELDRDVRGKIDSTLGEDEIFFPDTISITYIEEADASSGDQAVIALTAEAMVPVFTESKLAKVIAQEGNVQYESRLEIENVNDLAILTEAEEEGEDGAIRLTISGEAQLVGAYDQTQLISDLAGKDRRNVGVVLSGYPAIADMKISVYPFWRGTLPEKVEKLTVHVVE